MSAVAAGRLEVELAQDSPIRLEAKFDCAPGELCHIDSRAMRFSRKLFWLSVTIYVIAVTATYAALWWVRMQS